MKQRKLAFVIILGLITLGFYDLYWLFSTRGEMVAKGHKVLSLWRALLYPLIGIAAAILIAVFGSSLGHGLTSTLIVVVLIFLSVIAWIVLWIRFLASYCRAAEQITNNDLAYNYGFWMGILLYIFRVGFIWEAIVQYHFNRLGTPAPVVPQAYSPTPIPSPPTTPLPPANPQPPVSQPQVIPPTTQQPPASPPSV